jgi:capsid protein
MFGFFGWTRKAYDAVATNKRRRQTNTDLRTEDKLLLPVDRAKLISMTRSLRRNASIVAWAIRKHLDYVSTFNFKCRAKHADPKVSAAINARVEALMDWWSRPLNCDVSGRFALPQMIRMLESGATVDGDSLIYKLSDGRIQIIEGDRIRTPADLGDYAGKVKPEDFTHGIKTSASGAPLLFAVCDRTAGPMGFKLNSLVQAKYVYHHGYFDRYEQTRGISPLSSALNQFMDLYEGQEYALAKMKLAQLFGLKITNGEAVEGDDGKDYEFDFGAGPQTLQLVGQEDAEFMESNSPSVEFQQFMQTGIMIGLKALDIPFCFFDEAHQNYSGTRQAILQYELSADNKRFNLQQKLNALTAWRLGLFIADGELVLPDGMTIDDLKFEWVPVAIPWIDPLKEVTANTLAVQGCFRSRQMICKETGSDFFEVADQIAEENDYLRGKGLNPDIGNVTQVLGEFLNADSGDKKAA